MEQANAALRPWGRKGMGTATPLDGSALPQESPQWSTAKRFSSWSEPRLDCDMRSALPVGCRPRATTITAGAASVVYREAV